MNKIIVELRGGLGNQLFCYAFGYAQAKINGCDLIIDTSMNDSGIQRPLEIDKLYVDYKKRISVRYSTNYILRLVGFNYFRRKIKIGLFTRTYVNNICYLDYEPISISHNTYFRGYWQNWRFFNQYRGDFIKMIKNNDKYRPAFSSIVNSINFESGIAVHFRRGDYISEGLDLPDSYYIKALKRVYDENKTYYIFSDDPAYCSNFFKLNFPNLKTVLVGLEYELQSFEEMILMSYFSSLVMANSSFSWWSGYLSNNVCQRIICPIFKMWTSNYYLDDWIKINVDE